MALAGTACGDDEDEDDAGVANPASEYCESQGGTVVIVNAADGSQFGNCRLPDGSEVDEWDYYRARQTSQGPETTSP